jgi:hypothetical protein
MTPINNSANAFYMLSGEQLCAYGQQCADIAVQRIKEVLRQHSEMQIKPLYKKSDVAKIFGVTPRTIDNWIDDGIILPTRIGAIVRIEHEEVLRLKQLFKTK